MKRLFSAIVVVMMLLCCTSMIAFGAPDGNSLDDVINGGTTSESSQTQQSSGTTDENKQNDREKKNQNFIAGLNDAADLSGEVDGVSEVTSGIKLVAAWLVQIISYAVTVLLALRVVLDLAYIGLPFTRSFLANGYQGNPQAGAGGMPNSMMGGGMGMGAPGMGMGGMGMGGMGMRGGYGMNRGMGMMGGGMGMGQPGMAAPGMNQNGTMLGKIQWVSNAALNAVAGESSVGPDGRAVSPFKAYTKDMIIVLILVPILITLAVTGTLTNLGFLIADLIVDAIAGIGDMI